MGGSGFLRSDFWQWAHQLPILLWPDRWWWFTIFWHQILKDQFWEKFTNLLQETALESTQRLIQFCTFSPLSRITPAPPQLTEFSLLMEISDVCTLKLREISNSGHATVLLYGQRFLMVPVLEFNYIHSTTSFIICACAWIKQFVSEK